MFSWNVGMMVRKYNIDMRVILYILIVKIGIKFYIGKYKDGRVC